MISCDFETYLISNEHPWPKPVCLSYYDGTTGGVVVGSNMEQTLKLLLESKEIIIAHNLSFELNVISTWYPNLKALIKSALKSKRLVCTKIYEQLLDCQRKKTRKTFNLADLVAEYFQVDIKETKKNPHAWRLRYHELDGIPLDQWPKEAYDYSLEDSIWCYKIHQQQLKENNVEYNLSVAAEYYLNSMGTVGTNIDQSRVATIKQELEAKIIDYKKKLFDSGLYNINKKGKVTKNMKIFRQLLVDSIPEVLYSPKGTVKTDGEALDFYISVVTDNNLKEILIAYSEIMDVEKTLTAYIKRLQEASPFIRSTYNAVVSTGRTSSSTSSSYPSMNIQQQPRGLKGTTWDIRNCFVPRPGYKICSIDYSGLELTCTAQQLYNSGAGGDMLAVINSGVEPVDMHSMLAYRIMNMKEKTNESYLSFVANKKREPYKNYRQLAKPINLGFPGGIGYDTMRTLLAREGIQPKLKVLESLKLKTPSPLAIEHTTEALQRKVKILRGMNYPVRVRRPSFDTLEIIEDELVALKWELYNLYPDLKYFLKEGHKKFLTGETKQVKNEFGEWETEDMYTYSIPGFKRDWCQYTQVCNGYLMQAPGASGAKLAASNFIAEYINSEVIIPTAFIHDELVFEIKECSQMYGLIQDVAEIMLTSMRQVLPDVRIAVEAEAMDYWMKSGGFYSKTFWLDPKDKRIKSK